MTPSLEERLAKCSSLPSLPSVAVRVIELGQDPDVDPAEVARIISLDPALAAKLLKIANSPLYALRRKVDNLRQGLMLIGLNAALTLALSFSLVGGMRSPGGRGMDHGHYWRRSILAGIASRILGEQVGLKNLDELFLAGLLQDLGMLVLDQVMGEEYGEILAGTSGHAEVVAAERGALGSDHAEVGAWLMESWNLPDSLRSAVLHSHDEAGADAVDGLPLQCVSLSGQVADVLLNRGVDHAGEVIAALCVGQRLMDAEAFERVIDRVVASVPEASKVFEIDLLGQESTVAILDRAREVLMVRNLQMIEEVNQARQQAQVLESRARDLEEQVRRDPLTGIYNRAHLDEFLRREFVGATDCGWPLSIAFLDLDHFKRVNDTYGHQVGDHVLRSVAALLSGNLRKTDLTARYGGEEFMVVLPGTPEAGARIVLTRLRERVACTPHARIDGLDVHISVSIGLATHMDGKRFDDLESMVRGADRAVYMAKRGGRDRLVVYGSEEVGA